MLAVVACALFVIAFFVNGSAVTVHSHWFNAMGLAIAGLVFLSAHVVRKWPWW